MTSHQLAKELLALQDCKILTTEGLGGEEIEITKIYARFVRQPFDIHPVHTDLIVTANELSKVGLFKIRLLKDREENNG